MWYPGTEHGKKGKKKERKRKDIRGKNPEI